MQSRLAWIHLLLVLTVLLPPALLTRAEAHVVRQPVFAGRFYPADPEELKDLLSALDRQARQTPIKLPDDRALKAIVMPHAGYIYSGWTAAHAGHVLREHGFAKVIVLAPDHRVGFTNGMISDVDAYQTPLGRIRLHADARRLREENALFDFNRESDAREHSLEVVLPFLQHYLKDFELVPVVLGPSNPNAMADVLAPHLGPDTLLVVSSDLSHYLPYEQAVAHDRQTLDLIMGFEVEALARRENCACGRAPLQVLMTLARRLDWEPVLLHYANSGDTAGGKERVVGYAALAFYGDATAAEAGKRPQVLSPSQGDRLVRLARETIAAALKDGSPGKQSVRELPDQPVFDQTRGVFVTLEQQGRLRGCIGNLVAEEPLRTTVPRNALRAAFNDPRFAPLAAAEFDTVSVSVSVLSPPVRLVYRDAHELIDRLQPHRDGVILQHGRARATFLPQVWDQIPEPDSFISALCRKAGLRPDTWQREQLVIHTYAVQYFDEKP
ncbi:MAG: AmmeMemoRadiSam system protein B [Desulfobacterales bacterium]|jgi:hypothetical protein